MSGTGGAGYRYARAGEWSPEDECGGGQFLHRVVAYSGPLPQHIPNTWGETLLWLRVLARSQETGRPVAPIPGHGRPVGPGRPTKASKANGRR